MSRYIGPRLRVMRALGVELPGLSAKKIERRPYPPGQHGQARRKKPSEFSLRLKEKQKLRMHYGVSERQMRRIMIEAASGRVPTGVRLAQLLELRLDNLLFRSGLAPTIPAARQRVTHGHVLVNGKRLDIPSARLRVGDVLALDPKSSFFGPHETEIAQKVLLVPEWLKVDAKAATSTLASLPDDASIPFPIELRLVVEYYAR